METIEGNRGNRLTTTPPGNPPSAWGVPSAATNAEVGFAPYGRMVYPYSPLVTLAFLLFVVYSTLPLIDVPGIGLSLSAPLFFFVALHVLVRPPEPWLSRYIGWILLGASFWVGLFIADAVNGFVSGGVNFESSSVLTLIRYAYWLLVMVVTAYFIEYLRLGVRAARWLALGVFLLGLVRLGEAVFYDRIGAYANPQVFTQNTYGVLFSTFVPFLFYFFISGRGWTKAMAGLILILTGLAIAINGSRGSWIGVGVGLAVFVLVYAALQPFAVQRLFSIFLLAALFFAALQSAPPSVADAIDQRFASFETLEMEKSYATRQLMLQKGWRLFLSSPIYGVGLDRFRKTTIELEMPAALRGHNPQKYQTKLPHNSYIAVLAEAGLAGALPYAALLLVLTFRGLRGAWRLGRRGQLWGLATYASFIGMSVHLWAVDSITNTGTWMNYGYVIALIMTDRALREVARDEGNKI